MLNNIRKIIPPSQSADNNITVDKKAYQTAAQIKHIKDITASPINRLRIDFSSRFLSAEFKKTITLDYLAKLHDDLALIFASSPEQEMIFAAHKENFSHFLATGDIKTPLNLNDENSQFFWGSVLALYAAHPEISQNWHNRNHAADITKSAIWRRIASSTYMQQELQKHAMILENSLSNKKAKIVWSGSNYPNINYCFIPDKNLIIDDMLWTLVAGADAATPAINHEIAHSQGTQFSKTPRMEIIEKRQKELMDIMRAATQNKDRETYNKAAVEATRLKLEFQYRFYFLDELENMYANRFAVNFGGKYDAARLNELEADINVGKKYFEPQTLEEAQKKLKASAIERIMHVKAVARNSFFANNQLISPNKYEEWHSLHLYPELLSGVDNDGHRMGATEAFEYIREICDKFETSQPSSRLKNLNEKMYQIRMTSMSKRRTAMADEFFDMFVAQDMEELYKAAEKQFEEQNKQLQSQMQNQQKKQGNPKSENTQDNEQNGGQGDHQSENTQDNEQNGEQGNHQSENTQDNEQNGGQGNHQSENTQDNEQNGGQGDHQSENTQDNEQNGGQGDHQSENTQDNEQNGEQGDHQSENTQDNEQNGEQGDHQSENTQDNEQNGGQGDHQSENTQDNEQNGEQGDHQSENTQDNEQNGEQGSPQSENTQDNEQNGEQGNHQSENTQDNEQGDHQSENTQDSNSNNARQEQQSENNTNNKNTSSSSEANDMSSGFPPMEQFELPDTEQQYRPQLSEEQIAELLEKAENIQELKKLLEEKNKTGEENKGKTGQEPQKTQGLNPHDSDKEQSDNLEDYIPQNDYPTLIDIDQMKKLNDDNMRAARFYREGNWDEYQKYIAQYENEIAQAKKLIAEIIKQNKLDSARRGQEHIKEKMTKLPIQGGQTIDLQRHIALEQKLRRKDPNITRKDLERFRTRYKYSEDELLKEIEIPQSNFGILIDGSGSMTGLPFENALAISCILYEAARSFKEINVYIYMMGEPTPLTIACPDDRTVEIAKRLESVRQGQGGGNDFLTPAIRQLLIDVSENMQKHPHIKSGFTHIFSITDGGNNDYASVDVNGCIEKMLAQNEQITFDSFFIDGGWINYTKPLIKKLKNKGSTQIDCVDGIDAPEKISTAITEMLKKRMKHSQIKKPKTNGVKQKLIVDTLKSIKWR